MKKHKFLIKLRRIVVYHIDFEVEAEDTSSAIKLVLSSQRACTVVQSTTEMNTQIDSVTKL